MWQKVNTNGKYHKNEHRKYSKQVKKYKISPTSRTTRETNIEKTPIFGCALDKFLKYCISFEFDFFQTTNIQFLFHPYIFWIWICCYHTMTHFHAVINYDRWSKIGRPRVIIAVGNLFPHFLGTKSISLYFFNYILVKNYFGTTKKWDLGWSPQGNGTINN
jgi:hypothetical protein